MRLWTLLLLPVLAACATADPRFDAWRSYAAEVDQQAAAETVGPCEAKYLKSKKAEELGILYAVDPATRRTLRSEVDYQSCSAGSSRRELGIVVCTTVSSRHVSQTICR